MNHIPGVRSRSQSAARLLLVTTRRPELHAGPARRTWSASSVWRQRQV